ncbi:rho-related GTP-binding protein RhoD-like [Crassostrea virginica]|uniref:Rho-related GTP-binding protein RhoD-like n=1 Tax=Crassostrea virginica TaxID=6565 RepID=A0A8B8DXI6_CRAVI|nr:rho-related GTP-binding protein RhoD-like [Crassostrea virginica]
MKMPLSYLKCSLVGDACVGKTHLTKVFVGEKGDDEYTPTIFENYYGETICRGKPTSISIYDLPGQHDFNQMRKFALKDSNVVIICYDVQKRKSFDNVKSVWIPEIRQFLGKSVPIILVGILSSNMKHRSVSRREAIEVTSQMLIRDYFEIYGDDNVEISCLFSYIASIAKKSTKRNLSFLKRLFVK